MLCFVGQHSIKNGLRNNMPKGEQASCVKLSEKDVLENCILLQEKKIIVTTNR